ncbi:MAG: hypothetical protein F4220_04280 [Gammaproteobacteria bacterium]|nr:hypothetical protein [Gammaproteobacteria bacterium]
MRDFVMWRLGLLAAVCVAALAIPSVEAARQDEAPRDERTPAQTGSDSSAGYSKLPTEEQSDADAEAQDAEPGAPALLAPITTEAIEANANVDLPQDI